MTLKDLGSNSDTSVSVLFWVLHLNIIILFRINLFYFLPSLPPPSPLHPLHHLWRSCPTYLSIPVRHSSAFQWLRQLWRKGREISTDEMWKGWRESKSLHPNLVWRSPRMVQTAAPEQLFRAREIWEILSFICWVFSLTAAVASDVQKFITCQKSIHSNLSRQQRMALHCPFRIIAILFCAFSDNKGYEVLQIQQSVNEDVLYMYTC